MDGAPVEEEFDVMRLYDPYGREHVAVLEALHLTDPDRRPR